MWKNNLFLFLGCLFHIHSALSWTCSEDTDCSTTQGAVCTSGTCRCPAGQQIVLGGTQCVPSSPYLSSPCIEDHQCANLFTNFECRKSGDSEEGNCFCSEGFHYVSGRCWQTIGYEAPCTRNEQCMGELQDPFSLSCVEGVCGCAEGFYRRQRGECRKIGYAVGDGCVLDEDCQFEDGQCNINTFSCYREGEEISEEDSEPNPEETEENARNIESLKTIQDILLPSVLQNGVKASQDGRLTRQDGVACDGANPCSEPFICSAFGGCVCPTGYYSNNAGTICYAELGSPSTEEQCVGLFAEVRNGLCTCPANFYFEENMRDCTKVVRTLTDGCIQDNMCHTFGTAVRCGSPSLPWNIRFCECITELAVWDEQRSMCRLFAGIGESCQTNSDCMAGEFEIECVVPDVEGEGEGGEGVCTCPAGTVAEGGLCLTAGLNLGDSCQASQECTGAENIVCDSGSCACGPGYAEVDQPGSAEVMKRFLREIDGEDEEVRRGVCVPTIGGNCAEDSDCLKDSMVCETNGIIPSTCQCHSRLVEYDYECWEPAQNSGVCNVTAQCQATMGENSVCQGETCVCLQGFHFRDGQCWAETGLFESCGRTSECYLAGNSDRVVCRNSMCQCDFEYPYIEQLNTCASSASTSVASLFVVLLALYCHYLN